MTHTPGPWIAYNCDVQDPRPLGDDGLRFWSVKQEGCDYRGDVAHIHCALNIGGVTVEERDANARLIAAAPDLLEALQDAVDVFGGMCDDEIEVELLPRLRAVIAKATGQKGGAA